MFSLICKIYDMNVKGELFGGSQCGEGKERVMGR
jgi:hypothetical protein